MGAVAVVSAVQGAESDPADVGSAADPTVAASATPTPEPSATAGYVPIACATDALQVAETSARESYAGGSPVTFTLSVTNVGTVPCLLDGGTASLGVVVTSGADRVWASVDCPGGDAERRLLLDVGSSEGLTVTWEQERSEPGCPASDAAVGEGTYRASVTTDGAGSVLASWEHPFTIE